MPACPYRKRGYWYFNRFEIGKEYPIYARKAGTLEAPEQLMLDVNVLAQGFEFYAVGAREVSPDNRILAYAEDNVGRRQWSIPLPRTSQPERRSPDRIVNVDSSIAWAADSRTVLYVEKHPETLLAVQGPRKHVIRHGSQG